MNDDTPKRRIPPSSEVFEDPGLRRAAAAAEAGDLTQIRSLGEIDLNAMAPVGLNLLMFEIVSGNEVAVRTLLEAGADPNFKPKQGPTPMTVAAANEDSRWLKLLLDNGGDPNLEDAAGEPLLTRVIMYERWNNVLVLLDRGADVNKVGPSGQSAAFLAGSLHRFEWVNTLLDRGADPTLKDKGGLQLRDFVVQRVAPDSPEGSWQKKVAERIGA
jgi:uncharacterized protein